MNRWPCGWKHVVGKLWMGERTRNVPGLGCACAQSTDVGGRQAWSLQWEEGRLGLCGPLPCDTAPGPSSQEVRLPAPTVMPCSPFFPLRLQPRLSSSPCSWPASTAAATPGSTCSSRATSSKNLCSASSAAHSAA